MLPLLALTACAGSQRFGGGPGFSSGPSYSQPSLPSAPPISSAPVTSQPLPPPGGYPVASAPGAPGALPPPGDPYYNPSAGQAAQQPQSLPPAASTEVPQLRGGGGQVATLGQGAQSAAPRSASRDSVVGGWTAREATGTSCRVQLSSTPALDLYRANAAGCANRDLQKVNAWDYRDGEIYLYQPGGTVVARLRSDGSSMNGAITKSGAALSLSR